MPVGTSLRWDRHKTIFAFLIAIIRSSSKLAGSRGFVSAHLDDRMYSLTVLYPSECLAIAISWFQRAFAPNNNAIIKSGAPMTRIVATP